MDKGAAISANGLYRYKLWRIWDETLPLVLFIGLNPSTADHQVDDPTLKKCMKIAENWGYGGILMGNLFAYRSTDPSNLTKAEDPVGKENNQALMELKQQADTVVAAWGNHGTLLGRNTEVEKMFETLYCLGVTKAGNPKHPLYQPNDSQQIIYQ